MPRKRHAPPREDDIARQLRKRVAELPHCELIDAVVLQPGPASYQVAALLQFRDPQTGRPTHRELHLNDFPFRVLAGMKWAVKDRLAHWACGEAELQRLGQFLASASGEAPGTPGDDIPTWVAGLNLPQLATLVAALGKRGKHLRLLPGCELPSSQGGQGGQGGQGDDRARTAAALRAAHRSTALINLRQLIDRRARPGEFRSLLESHAWMFGRLYLEQCSEPALAGDTGELLLLRTADAGLDVVLLMPIDAPLATDDPAARARGGAGTDLGASTAAHDAAFSSAAAPGGARRMTGHARLARPGGSPVPQQPVCVTAEVAGAVAYAAACVGQLTQDRGALLAAWGVKPARVTARVVLGYLDPLSPQTADRRRCLEQFNDRLAGIEVCGYDRLVEIAENVLEADLAESGIEQYAQGRRALL